MVKKQQQSPRKIKLAESERALRDIKKKVSAWKAQLAELDRISGALNKNLGRLMRIRETMQIPRSIARSKRL